MGKGDGNCERNYKKGGAVVSFSFGLVLRGQKIDRRVCGGTVLTLGLER